jgi:hypothetical protein
MGILADPKHTELTAATPGGGLEKNLRPIGRVHPIVTTRRRFALLHTGRLGSLIGHPGSPNLLVVDRREPIDLLEPNRGTVGRKLLG